MQDFCISGHVIELHAELKLSVGDVDFVNAGPSCAKVVLDQREHFVASVLNRL